MGAGKEGKVVSRGKKLFRFLMNSKHFPSILRERVTITSHTTNNNDYKMSGDLTCHAPVNQMLQINLKVSLPSIRVNISCKDRDFLPPHPL